VIEIVTAFRDAMDAGGVPIRDEIIYDGEIHRYDVVGDRRRSKNGWAVLHLDNNPAGAFGCNKRGVNMRWSAGSTTSMSPEERAALKAKIAADRVARAASLKASQAAAAVRANEIWDAAVEVEQHPYLTRKGIGANGARVGVWVKEWIDRATGEVHERRIPNSLIIPIRNIRREIVSLEAIFPERDKGLGRDKDFLSDGEKQGCGFTLGKPVEHDGKPVVIICEGLATGASVHESTGHCVVVAFTANNLEPVARAVRNAMPAPTIIIAGDNDQWTETPVRNPGATSARTAAAACGGLVAIPQFLDLSKKPTDFNDLCAAEGAEEVKRQVLGAVRPAAALDVNAAPTIH
jgi:putative DNA primase/helicase